MLSVAIYLLLHYAECRHAECRNAECCHAECRNAECCNAECCNAECCYSECCYAECRYDECHGAVPMCSKNYSNHALPAKINFVENYNWQNFYHLRNENEMKSNKKVV